MMKEGVKALKASMVWMTKVEEHHRSEAAAG